jgi:hypothetical protein
VICRKLIIGSIVISIFGFVAKVNQIRLDGGGLILSDHHQYIYSSFGHII